LAPDCVIRDFILLDDVIGRLENKKEVFKLNRRGMLNKWKGSNKKS